MKKLIAIMVVMIVVTGGATLLADSVTVSLTQVNPGVDASVNGEATTAGVMNLVINGVGVLGYCVDPADVGYNDPQTYYLIDLPTDPWYTQAAWIFSTYGTPSDAVTAGNVQMAIWTVMPGMFVTSGMTAEAQQIANAAVAAVNGGWNATSGYSLVVSPDPNHYFGTEYQDFIIHTPEPTSVLLLGLGLFGVGLVGRKKLS